MLKRGLIFIVCINNGFNLLIGTLQALTMSWLKLIVLMAAVGGGSSINKPVFKIILTQKGFAQFLQYDIEIPPIREFTFCTWIRFDSIDGDQSIFTYVANGNNHVIRLWLDSGGEVIRISIDDKASFEVPVEIAKGTWRHICFSYQSDFGAWALYLDSRLITCEATQSLYGHIIPGGGSVLVGYGISNANGIQNGVQGEIFGVNMILLSTIERNYTVKNHPLYEQKPFAKDKVKHDDIEYTVLKDLKIDDTYEIKNEQAGSATNFSKSFIYFKTPDSFIEHEVGKINGGRIPKQTSPSNEEEILDVIKTESEPVNLQKVTKNPNEFDFWNLVDDNDRQGKFKVPENDESKPISFTKQAYPMLPEYETPPPITAKNEYSVDKSMELGKSSINDLIYNFDNKSDNRSQMIYNKRQMNEISEIEIPPLPVQDPNVYGQWTSSKFAGSVLNYLKSINFHNQDKRIPPTIHLNKVSDTFPYATDLKINLIKPSASFKRKNLIIENRKYYQNNMLNNAHAIHSSHLHRKNKRHAIMPQINVQIVDTKNREEILKTHAQTKPVNVEITPRSESKKVMGHRFYRNIDVSSAENTDVVSEPIKPKPFTISNNKWLNLDLHKTNSLLTVLPFLKSIEYFTEESENSLSNRAIKNHDMYAKSLHNRNKWHNIKSYNNDFTPRRFNMNPQNGKTALDNNISEANIKHPSIRIKYKPEINKVVENREDEHIRKGRVLAGGVSNQSDHKNTVSILKYNHGYLPGHEQKSKKLKVTTKLNSKPTGINSGAKNFDKHVKIGNALNEQDIIGKNLEEKKKSFEGGNKNIPDIQRYRSVFDNETNGVPNSLRPRVCKNVELYNRLLYVQPDESIDMTHILSPIKKKNIGIQFILQNYKRCSLDESPLRKNNLLLIDWNVTPVRLFGGAMPRKTTDLCGFF